MSKQRVIIRDLPPIGEESIQEVDAPEPMCEESPYPRFKVGNYEVRCVAAEIYRDKRFGAWKCRLVFKTVWENRAISGFFHLGKGEKPNAGRGSRYRRAWVIANGDAPKRRQILSKRVFVDKFFLVAVDDTTKRYDGMDHAPGDVYSTVKEILKRTGP